MSLTKALLVTLVDQPHIQLAMLKYVDSSWPMSVTKPAENDGMYEFVDLVEEYGHNEVSY